MACPTHALAAQWRAVRSLMGSITSSAPSQGDSLDILFGLAWLSDETANHAAMMGFFDDLVNVYNRAPDGLSEAEKMLAWMIVKDEYPTLPETGNVMPGGVAKALNDTMPLDPSLYSPRSRGWTELADTLEALREQVRTNSGRDKAMSYDVAGGYGGLAVETGRGNRLFFAPTGDISSFITGFAADMDNELLYIQISRENGEGSVYLYGMNSADIAGFIATTALARARNQDEYMRIVRSLMEEFGDNEETWSRVREVILGEIGAKIIESGEELISVPSVGRYYNAIIKRYNKSFADVAVSDDGGGDLTDRFALQYRYGRIHIGPRERTDENEEQRGRRRGRQEEEEEQESRRERGEERERRQSVNLIGAPVWPPKWRHGLMSECKLTLEERDETVEAKGFAVPWPRPIIIATTLTSPRSRSSFYQSQSSWRPKRRARDEE